MGLKSQKQNAAAVNAVEDKVAPEEEKSSPKKAIVTYFSPYLKVSFGYNKVDEKGAVMYKTNPETGILLRDGDGRKQPISVTARFQVANTVWSKGYLSRFDFDPNDKSAQNVEIGKELEKLSADRSVRIWEEAVYIEKTNPAQYKELMIRKGMEEKLAAAEAKASKVDDLEARLAEIENKK